MGTGNYRRKRCRSVVGCGARGQLNAKILAQVLGVGAQGVARDGRPAGRSRVSAWRSFFWDSPVRLRSAASDYSWRSRQKICEPKSVFRFDSELWIEGLSPQAIESWRAPTRKRRGSTRSWFSSSTHHRPPLDRPVLHLGPALGAVGPGRRAHSGLRRRLRSSCIRQGLCCLRRHTVAQRIENVVPQVSILVER